MSLFDRVFGEEANKGSFKSCGGSLFTTDRSRKGKRNSMPGGAFVGKNKRYPTDRCWASTAGSMSQAHQRGVLKKKTAAGAPDEVCPTAKKGCPPKRNHGEGGKTPKSSPPSRDHGGTSEWPFKHSGGPKWDKDWSKIGHEKGSSGLPSQKGEPKRKTFKGTKGHQKAQKKDLKKELTRTKAAMGGQAAIGTAGGDMDKVQKAAKGIAKHAKKATQANERRKKRKGQKGGKLPEMKPELKGKHKQKVPSASGSASARG